jgi:hypothetical protein
MISVLGKHIDDRPAVAPSQYSDQKGQERVHDVSLIKVSNYGKIAICGGKYETAKRRCSVNGTHPKNGNNLALDKRFVEISKMGCHVKHG